MKSQIQRLAVVVVLPGIVMSRILPENAVSLWKVGRSKEGCTCSCLGMDLENFLSLVVQELHFYMRYRPSERNFRPQGCFSDEGLTYIFTALLCDAVHWNKVFCSTGFSNFLLGLFASQARHSGNNWVLCSCMAGDIKVSLLLLNSMHNVVLVTTLERSVWQYGIYEG